MLAKLQTTIQNLIQKSTKNNKLIFENIMQFASEIEKKNPEALIDLVRVLLKPLQSDYLVSCIENENHHSKKPIKSFDFFMPNGSIDIQFASNYPKLDSTLFLIDLKKDSIFPGPWERSRYVTCLSYIGSNKKLGDFGGNWKQDFSNHYIHILLPWGLVFVEGGNHSIASGIISGEGTLIPNNVYDMSDILNKIKCDGINYISIEDNQIINSVYDIRIAAVFEIGRLLKKHNIMPMHI